MLKDGQLILLYPDNKIPHFEFPAQLTNSDDVPTLQVFLLKPDNSTRAVAIICPGGSYSHVSTVQSDPYAKLLTENGVTAFVLRYRRNASYRTDGPHYLYPIPLEDGQRAVRQIRTHAKAWGLDADRLIVLGCSAGGHLASWLATHPDEGKPDAADPVEKAATRLYAQVLLSPVSTMKADYSGTRSNFLTAEQAKDAKLLKSLSAEDNVAPETPRAFIWHALDDNAVGAKGNSDAYAAALREKKVPVYYLRTPKGGHVKAVDALWSEPLLNWLRLEKLASGVAGALPAQPPIP